MAVYQECPSCENQTLGIEGNGVTDPPGYWLVCVQPGCGYKEHVDY
jgi:hypothetical protein